MDSSLKIHAFDFDGTLTNRDTLLEFIRFVRGDKAFFLCMLRYLPLLLLMKFGLYPNWKVKQKVFAHCFGGMKLDEFNNGACALQVKTCLYCGQRAYRRLTRCLRKAARWLL